MTDERMREVLEKLTNEVSGFLGAFGHEISHIVSGTKIAVLWHRVEAAREALSPPARRTVYEWEFDGTRYRTRFTEFRGFITEINFHGDAWARVEAIDAPAATFAIATLAGLEQEDAS